jgi:hypothetical protein
VPEVLRFQKTSFAVFGYSCKTRLPFTLEALREIVLHYPEICVVENVWGFRKFRRAIETFRCLPLYHCTEFRLRGEDFAHQKKKRVFLILHRQPYDFPTLGQYQRPRPGTRLKD